MKNLPARLALSIAVFLSCVVHAAEDPNSVRLATCQSSWLDWQQNPVMQEQFKKQIESSYREEGNDGSYLPKAATTTLLGLPVSRLFPQSVGQGLGYSVLVDAGLKDTQSALVKQVGKPFGRCQKYEGMTSCELVIGHQKTITLLEVSQGKKPQTLLGCYYYYQK